MNLATSRYVSSSLSLLCLLSSFALADEPATTLPSDEQLKREAAFVEMLSGATLIGHFTVTGNEPKGEPPRLRGERYDLVEVRKIDEQHWLFKARIRYGDHDVTIPMTLPVEWAGDTPVVVVDNLGFPGLGTYSARVLFHKDHYAGFWSGTDRGGHLFGTIERSKPADDNTTDE
ncbi:hypothetical protein [Aeoliella mucimassa]|uniref:Uncharacterized protein n=1 Tax=Aeoliella mucimassa TaxID=2527972 RepID=A0A518AWL0_9BACT|nr:hypothetical protein [Aeoliella mucimassa]QDU59122.1 hypothetical protein Pan181_53630 [Aeoliella mucimassa]